MYSVNDIVCNLIQTPFSRLKDDDKRDVLNWGQPTDIIDISRKRENKKSGKTYSIKFKNSWFDTFTWLCRSTYLQALYCWPCLLFSNKSNVWRKEGFSDFVNITHSLHKHKDSAHN